MLAKPYQGYQEAEMPTKQGRPEVHLDLTDAQRKQIAKFVRDTGDSRLAISVHFEADVDKGTISPATFLVGNAI